MKRQRHWKPLTENIRYRQEHIRLQQQIKPVIKQKYRSVVLRWIPTRKILSQQKVYLHRSLWGLIFRILHILMQNLIKKQTHSNLLLTDFQHMLLRILIMSLPHVLHLHRTARHLREKGETVQLIASVTPDNAVNKKHDNQKVISSKTGDTSDVTLWTTVFAAALAGIIGIFAGRKKEQQ